LLIWRAGCVPRFPIHHLRKQHDRLQSLARAQEAPASARSNTLKDIGRLLGVADNTHTDRKDKLLSQAAYLNDTALAARGNYFKIQRLQRRPCE
jgi:hypothetical protein